MKVGVIGSLYEELAPAVKMREEAEETVKKDFQITLGLRGG